MGQTALSLLLALSLVLCPLNCFGTLQAQAGKDTTSAACTCCQRHDTELTGNIAGDEPLAPVSEDGRGSCLCQGAILPAQDGGECERAADPFQTQPASLTVGFADFSSTALAGFAPLQRLTPCSTGYALRVLHQSLLL